MNRAERRHQAERIKARTLYRGAIVNHMDRESLTPAWVGRTAAVHWTCMCRMCRAAKHIKPDTSADERLLFQQ